MDITGIKRNNFPPEFADFRKISKYLERKWNGFFSPVFAKFPLFLKEDDYDAMEKGLVFSNGDGILLESIT